MLRQVVLVCVIACGLIISIPQCNAQSDDEFDEFMNPEEVAVIEDDDGMINEEPRNDEPIPFTEFETDFDKSSNDDSFENDPIDEFVPDDEEFEGYVPESARSRSSHSSFSSGQQQQKPDDETSKKGGKPDLKIAKVPLSFRAWNQYTLEMFLLAIIFVYLVNFVIGRGTNARLATAWFAAHKELFEANFSLVGDDGQAEPGTCQLTKESESLYSLWCSGRVCCEGMLIELRLLKRQDLFSVILNWLKPVADSVVVKVVLDDGEMDGWVLSVGAKRTLGTLTKEHFDLATYPQDRRGQRYPGLPESLLVLSEIPEATAAILNPTICKLISDHQNSIEYLYFSDQYSGPRLSNEELRAPRPDQVQKVLIFSFLVGAKGTTTPEDMESIKPLFNFIFYMIDKARKIRLSREAKARSEKARARVTETFLKTLQAARQEAAQNRRDEQRRATKERIMAEENPEKARRLEEKEQRKESKRRQQRMKLMKVKGM